jgi:hypothetical protein
MDRRHDATGAMPRPQTWSRHSAPRVPAGSISIDPGTDKTRRSLKAEIRVSICPTFTQYKTALGQARDRGAMVSFNFLSPLIWEVGSSYAVN